MKINLKICFLILLNYLTFTNAFKCYSCKESINPKCGATLLLPITELTEEECTGGVCVTFKNKYDGGRYVRDCSTKLWVPPTGTVDESIKAKDQTCVKDKYSQELYCFCNTDLCNANNTGDMSIFIKDECASNPCVAGGTCVDDYNKYTCSCIGNYGGNCDVCKPDYTGPKCDILLGEPCLSLPCKNNAKSCTSKVVNNKYTYTCECKTDDQNKLLFNGTNCEIDVNECLEVPSLCKNNGICKNLPGDYECDCSATGYSGDNCETEINECEASTTPLLNKCSTNTQTCSNTPLGSYTCVCKAGFTGKYCDINIDDCVSNKCVNSKCIDEVNDYKCSCIAGYVLDQVDTKKCVAKTHCIEQPDSCNNNGQCLEDLPNDSFKCICKAGYTDSACSTQIKVCETFPCINGGTCSEEGLTYPDYTCGTCNTGFTGKNCETPINYCVPNPCVNGACSNKFGAYKCTCSAGWEGQKCDEQINLCEIETPCYPAGITEAGCTPLINNFKCNCKPGYTGVLCELDVNECLSNPCSNSGTCINGINLYTCICNENFTGKRCTTPIDHCDKTPPVCQNSAECLGGLGNEPVACVCTPGYKGKFCEIEYKPCDELTTSPCQNGGTCYNNINDPKSYKCSCPSNSKGEFCEIKISTCTTQKINCNYGVCQDTTTGFICKCNTGYKGLYCDTKYIDCTVKGQGTFADEAFCEKYYNCIAQETGGYTLESISCKILGAYQLLWDDAKKQCVFPGQHPTPNCYKIA